MRRCVIHIRTTLLAVMLISSTACSSFGPYFLDREHDLGDVFTVTAGVGAGASAKVGMLNLGLLRNSDMLGLRAGTLFGPIKQGKGKSEQIDILLVGVTYFRTESTLVRDKSIEEYKFLGLSGCSGAGKIDICRYQIEGVAAIGPSLRVGFNVAELLDFLLGWTTIDILDDDLLSNQQTKKIEASVQPAAGAEITPLFGTMVCQTNSASAIFSRPDSAAPDPRRD